MLLWAAFVAVLIGYLLVFPIRARLNKGVIERHTGREIWHAMRDGLPLVDNDWLLGGAFWIVLGFCFVGLLALIWCALDDDLTPPGNLTIPDDTLQYVDRR